MHTPLLHALKSIEFHSIGEVTSGECHFTELFDRVQVSVILQNSHVNSTLDLTLANQTLVADKTNE